MPMRSGLLVVHARARGDRLAERPISHLQTACEAVDALHFEQLSDDWVFVLPAARVARPARLCKAHGTGRSGRCRSFFAYLLREERHQ